MKRERADEKKEREGGERKRATENKVGGGRGERLHAREREREVKREKGRERSEEREREVKRDVHITFLYRHAYRHAHQPSHTHTNQATRIHKHRSRPCRRRCWHTQAHT